MTTALKLCCIGHQIPLGRDKIDTDLQIQFSRDNLSSNLPISDVQTLRNTFDQMIEDGIIRTRAI